MKNKETNQIVIYETEDGQTQIDVRLDGETVWLTQSQMTELFQTTKQNVSLHVGNVFKEGELTQASTVKEYLTVQQEGKRNVSRNVKYYNLDVIISVGYRVKSKRGTDFRIWARQILKDYPYIIGLTHIRAITNQQHPPPNAYFLNKEKKGYPEPSQDSLSSFTILSIQAGWS